VHMNVEILMELPHTDGTGSFIVQFAGGGYILSIKKQLNEF